MSFIPRLLALAIFASTLPASAQMRPESPGALGMAQPPPYEATSILVSSTPDAILMEIVVTLTDPGRLPSTEAVPAGLVAIGPTGNVRVVVVQADAALASQPKVMTPLDPAELPVAAVTVGTPGIWRDLRIVDVWVVPALAVRGQDYLARRLVVRIENAGGVGINEKTRPTRPVSPVWERMYRRHVLNYDSLNLPRLERGSGARYIVVSRTMFDTQTPQFVEWKTRQGYGVDIITLEGLGYTNPNTDAAMDATKNYIQNAYNTWPDGLDFVLLVGDIYSSGQAGSIYTKKFYNEFYYQGYMYHDQWYAYLEGSDVFADIMVGRLPDSNANRMNYMLAKTVGYEKTPYINGTWQKNALMTLKANHSSSTVNNHIIAAKNFVSDILAAWGMNVTERFQNQATSSQILPVVNAGITFYNARISSCSGTDWNGTFSSYDVSYVNNSHKIGVWSVLSCSSAQFDGSSSTTAELLLRRDYNDPTNPKGAVAFIGSQAYTSYLFNDPLDQGIYLAWTDSGATMVGQALLSGKLYAWAHATGLTSGERNSGMHEYAILGDPSLQVNTDVPKAATVGTNPSVVPIGATTNVTVSVSTIVGPVQGALVCLRKASEVYVWGYTNVGGQITLPVTPTTSGGIDVTVTAYNVQPYLGTLATSATIPPKSPVNVTASANAMGGVVLTWSPVTQDVAGSPITITNYSVYRHTVPHFFVGGLAPIASPSGTSYTDPARAGDPAVNYFYRIVAVSATQGSSGPSAPVGEFDYQMEQ